MKKIAIDTNYLIDIVIDRDTSKTATATLRKAMAEYDAVFVPFHAMVEFIYVLENIHRKEGNDKLTKEHIIEMVLAVCATDKFEVERVPVLLSAKELYKTNKIGDAIIAATLLENNIEVILSNDRHFQKINAIKVY